MSEVDIALVASLIVVLVILLIVIRILHRKLGSLETSIEALLEKIEQQRLEIDTTTRNTELQEQAIQELRAGTLGMGQKLKELSALTQLTRDKQEELTNQDPDTRMYSKARKLIEAGASVEELMTECELPRAEAELLLSVRKK